MPVRNVISWSCMLNGYVTSGEYKEALSLFRRMQTSEVDDVRPNAFTMSVVLSACGRLGALEHGKWAHAYIDKCGMEVYVILGTSLIDMYAKCGSIDRARWVFNNLGPNKDVMAWSTMISGLAMHGHGKECLELFSEMKNNEVRPNAITLLALYGCMVDLYGRTGLIKEAWDVVHSMPMEPDVLVWGALLSGSRMHGDIGTCEVALNKLIELEPTNSGAYVLLSNVYAKVGKWKDARNMRDLMEVNGVKKVPGCSLVEVDGVIHEFFVGDESHPETKEIYLMLEEILDRLNMKDYAGDTKEGL
ncbi:hypothetical protein RJ639_045531 [Escallonia herrerae]|uniref:Pentatricopeptide repeat-containing protein n=1 Tax=Escallonia herrerae TaxID=1293975 RepID=A0AA89AXI3_9ASTE|nr:hypothetical protein RJ639_045531 [Escallonia herrerae]